jgi:hypothetical protein
MFDKTCSIPSDEYDNMSVWMKQREVINDDGTCDHYMKEPLIEKIKDLFLVPYYRISRRVEAVIDFFKFSVFKRIKYKFDIRDTWCLTSSISEFIVPRLTYFINNKPMGTPGQLTNRKFVEEHDLAKYFKGELQDEWFDSDGDSNESYDAWMNILLAILNVFEYNSNEFDEKYNIMRTNEYGEREVDQDLLDKRNEMADEGLRLFALFFGNLWD